MKSGLSSLLLIFICLGAGIASISGFFPGERTVPPRSYETVRNEIVQLENRGLYKNDSVSVAAQARGQDAVTLVFGIPLFIASFLFKRKGSMRGRLLYMGCLGYFLYTYSSYAYLSIFNELYLLYVFLFSLSLFALIREFMRIDKEEVKASLSHRFPRRFLGSYLIGMGILLTLLWLGRIVPALLSGTAPYGLEHYSSLTIQTHDLAVIVPACILAGDSDSEKGSLRNNLGAVLLMKLLTMALALTAMMIAMTLSGISLNPAEVVIFGIILFYRYNFIPDNDPLH